MEAPNPARHAETSQKGPVQRRHDFRKPRDLEVISCSNSTVLADAGATLQAISREFTIEFERTRAEIAFQDAI